MTDREFWQKAFLITFKAIMTNPPLVGAIKPAKAAEFADEALEAMRKRDHSL